MTARQQGLIKLACFRLCAIVDAKSRLVYLSKNFCGLFEFSCLRLLLFFFRQRRGVKWQDLLLFRFQLSTHFTKAEYLSSLQREEDKNEMFCRLSCRSAQLQANRQIWLTMFIPLPPNSQLWIVHIVGYH